MSTNQVRLLYVTMVAILTMLVAALVMYGWLTRNLLLVQVFPTSSPLQFNTALCFLLSGLALLLLDMKRISVAAVLGIAVTLFSLITASQYLTGTDYGIDTLFIQPFTQANTTHVGRMAPNTAMVFILLGIIFCFKSLAPQSWRATPFIGALGGSFVAALGLVPLLGYMSSVETAYGWENFARMAVHTAFLAVLMGSAVVVHTWQKLDTPALWLPLPVGIAMVVVSISMAHAVRSQEHRQLELLLQADANHLSVEIEQELYNITHALKRITQRWATTGGTPRGLWEADTRAYLNDYPFLYSLAKLDKAGQSQWLVARQGSNGEFTSDTALPQQYQNAFENARKTHHAQNAGLVQLPDGKTGLLMIFSLSRGKQDDGFMVAILNVHRFLSEIAEAIAGDQVAATVSEQDKLLYSNSSLPIQTDERWQKKAVLESEDTPNWKLTVSPTEYLMNQQISRMPWVVLGVGLLTSLLVTWSLFLLLKQRQSALRLKEGKARLRAIFEHAADGITLIDSRGNIEDFNPACEKLFGYTLEEVKGQNVKMLMPEPYHSQHDGYLSHYQETGERKIIGIGREVQGKCKDGSTFDIDLRVSEVKIPRGKLYMGMFRDITERKNAENTQNQLIDKLTDSNTELERFAYVASHDLREPLRLVANFATLLKNEYREQLGEEGKEYINVIEDSSTRMHGMVGELLEYARIGNEEMRYTDVDMEVEFQHVLDNLGAFIKEHRATVTHAPLPTVRGNPVQLMRVMQNLIGNAIKFHSPNISPKVSIGAEKIGLLWRFHVQDNGIGMASDYTQQIFEPFRQLHARNEYHGTGIGLAICKRIIEKHGGTVWATSELGKGSMFYFTVPAQNC